MTGTRADTWEIGVEIDGVDYGIWDKFSGGATDSEETKYKPGGMEPEVSLGGSRTTENITIERLYDIERDHTIVRTLINKAGRGRMKVTKQPLDPDGVPKGNPLVYSGTLKAVTPPETDSESSDAALLSLEMSTSGTVG